MPAYIYFTMQGCSLPRGRPDMVLEHENFQRHRADPNFNRAEIMETEVFKSLTHNTDSGSNDDDEIPVVMVVAA